MGILYQLVIEKWHVTEDSKDGAQFWHSKDGALQFLEAEDSGTLKEEKGDQ